MIRWRKTHWVDQMNEWGAKRHPFFFMISYDQKQTILIPTEKMEQFNILIDFPGFKNKHEGKVPDRKLSFIKTPLSKTEFEKKFDHVVGQIQFGNSFLTNLTVKTPIESNYSLSDIFYASKARYKICYNDHFVFFSPETFINIQENHIYAYPMKGTIDASVNAAREVILQDKKETAEHVTIVDLLRNDLSQVADQVTVNRFRYIEEVQTHEKTLLQVSSEIVGKLPENWHQSLGTILQKLLPAGSITGAPKPKTLQIIRQVERYKRGFYTGIAGYFDGQSLDTCVMIRFIEKESKKLYFKSGVGITSFSNLESEYQEIIDKIYVPVY